MSIKSGTGTIARKHGKNFISAQADARLREVVGSYQAQGLRALEVDSFEIQYFASALSTSICTCKQTEVLPEHSQISAGSGFPPNLIKPEGIGESEIRIDYNRPLFGQPSESLESHQGQGSDLDILGEDENEIVGSPFSTSSDCGLCYRTGYVPGYHLYAQERTVVSTQDVDESYGFTIDLTTAPHTLVQVDPVDGFVQFVLEVPRYFKTVSVSVRNNTTIVENDEVLGLTLPVTNATGKALSLTDFRNSAGRQLAIRCVAEAFTHVVISYDLGADPVRANLAQMSKSTDWTMFSTLGNLQLVLPMTIGEVQAGDVVFVPSRRITLKVTDVTFLRTSQERNLDWSVATRVLQPQEALKFIASSRRLPL